MNLGGKYSGGIERKPEPGGSWKLEGIPGFWRVRFIELDRALSISDGKINRLSFATASCHVKPGLHEDREVDYGQFSGSSVNSTKR